MAKTLLVGSVMLAGISCASVSASEQGTAASTTKTQGFASGVQVQVVPAPALEEQLVITVLPGRVQEHFQAAVAEPPDVICGMKIWRADPNIDPGIYMPLPEGAAGAKIRRIPATECVAGASTAGHHVFKSVFGQTKSVTVPAAPVRK